MNSRALLFAAIAVLVIGVAAWAYLNRSGSSAPPVTQTQQYDSPNTNQPTPINTVKYSCKGGRFIIAKFYDGGPAPAAKPGEMPHPTGTVYLTFGDRPAMALPQTISADGARYADTGETFVFWSKGNGAMVLQNGAEKDYTDCSEADAPSTN